MLQRLEEELSAHQALLKSVARRGSRRRSHASNSPSDDEEVNGKEDSDPELSEMKAKWREISMQEAERKQQLQASLEYARPQESNGMQYPPVRRSLTFDLPESSSGGDDENLKASLTALNQCWEHIQAQVEDKQTRLEQAYEFQSAYQTALQRVSGWLDNMQLKLFSSNWQKDTETQLAEHANLQEEIHSFQDQLEVMNESCQAVLLETNEQSRQLIRQALGDLNSRMSTLETEAQQREQELVEKNRRQKAFQVECL